MKEKACFLDRDGTLNVEINYLHEPSKTVLEKNVPQALKLLQDNGFKLIVVTNQAGVAKKIYNVDDVYAVHEKIQELLMPYGVKLDGLYYCPHHEDFSGPCSCRKPEIGMFLQAAKDFNIDLEKSFMIGDRVSDIQAGENARCKKVFLVKQGYGVETLKKYPDQHFNVAEDILDAAEQIIAEK